MSAFLSLYKPRANTSRRAMNADPWHGRVVHDPTRRRQRASRRASDRLYVAYIITIALVDVSSLLHLATGLPPWAHVTITLSLSAIAITFASCQRFCNTRAGSARRETVSHLVRAHDERTGLLRGDAMV
jgi:hypothetical protein